MVAPREALAAADEDAAAGRAGSDVAALLAFGFVAAHLRELVAAAWVGYASGIRVGLSAIVGSISRAVAVDVMVLFGAALLLTVAVGRKRSIGRDIDLACVAFVPLLALQFAATLVFLLLGRAPSAVAENAIWAGGLVWCGAVLVLAWQHARRRAPAPEGS